MANAFKSKIPAHMINVIRDKTVLLSAFKETTKIDKKYRAYRVVRNEKIGAGRNKSRLKENSLVSTYVNIYSSALTKKWPTPQIKRDAFLVRAVPKISVASSKERRGYIKHMVRLRYRWHFRRDLGQFKLFRKFFRRTLKRYRKIQKNRLFVVKFRRNFSKLTGFNEKFIYGRWLQFRRNYAQYWSTTNAVLRFSQSLMLAPYGFLVVAKIAPSLAASKHLVNSGAININGSTATSFSNFIPGDILQINLAALQALRMLFNYQQWGNFNTVFSTLPFMHADWSSMVFMLVRWPRDYELIAPSFLSERWMRYYIRNFPSKVTKFKKLHYNTKIYRKLVTKK